EQPALALMASEATGGPCINLLQGEFATTPSLQERVRPWHPAIVAAALWLAFSVGAELFDYWRLQSENQQLQQRISSLYRKALPDSRMVNPKVQMERTLESLKRKLDGGEGVLQLLAVAGAPLSEETGVEVMGVSYHDNRLDMDLAAGNLQEIEEIRKAVAENERLVVALHSASTRNNRARGKITLKVKDQ
ncbi:MAG: type II secretion system protein GspL, partial [Candidatus Sedimenticola sp. 6PFRAG7]